MSRLPHSPPLSLGLSGSVGGSNSNSNSNASGGPGAGPGSPNEVDDGWTDLRADVVDSFMAEAALSEQFKGISGVGVGGDSSSSGSGPGARGGGGQRAPSYPGMPLSGPGPDTRDKSSDEGRQVIIPLDASDSYDDCKDRVHEKMSNEIADLKEVIANMKSELEAKDAELNGERLARSALEKRLGDVTQQVQLGSSRTDEVQAARQQAEDELATTKRELAKTTERFNSAMQEVVSLTSEINQLRKEQEDANLVSHLEAHTRHEEEIQRELQRVGHAHEQELRRLEEAYAHAHSALTQQSIGASEQPDLITSDDMLFGMPAGEDPIPRATKLAQRLTELPSLFDSLRARECRKIALEGFAIGELALFFPVPSKKSASGSNTSGGVLPPPPQTPQGAASPPIHQNYLAFNVLPKQPRYYIADESSALIGRKGVRHFNRKYVLGMIIEKTLHKADAAGAARYDIPVGTSYYTLLVNEVDYWN